MNCKKNATRVSTQATVESPSIESSNYRDKDIKKYINPTMVIIIFSTKHMFWMSTSTSRGDDSFMYQKLISL